MSNLFNMLRKISHMSILKILFQIKLTEIESHRIEFQINGGLGALVKRPYIAFNISLAIEATNRIGFKRLSYDNCIKMLFTRIRLILHANSTDHSLRQSKNHMENIIIEEFEILSILQIEAHCVSGSICLQYKEKSSPTSEVINFNLITLYAKKSKKAIDFRSMPISKIEELMKKKAISILKGIRRL